jgi:hypothetical protein
MTLIILTPDQLKLIHEATETVAFVDDRGQVLASINPSSHRSPGDTYTSIPELINDIGEWDEEEVKRRLERFQAAV